MSAKSHHRLDPELVKQNIDENTIGIFVILGVGSSFSSLKPALTGSSRLIQATTSRLRKSPRFLTNTRPRLVMTYLSMVCIAGLSPMFSMLTTYAVDGASGAFIAPFTYSKAGFKWHFELPRVRSINTSGHKFGLTYAGCGFIIWRDESYLPKHLIFELHYLGGTEESYTLNFSRPGAQM